MPLVQIFSHENHRSIKEMQLIKKLNFSPRTDMQFFRTKKIQLFCKCQYRHENSVSYGIFQSHSIIHDEYGCFIVSS